MHHGAAKAVQQDLTSLMEKKETPALWKIVSLGQQDVDAGRGKPVAQERLGYPELPDVQQRWRQPIDAQQRLFHAAAGRIQPQGGSTG